MHVLLLLTQTDTAERQTRRVRTAREASTELAVICRKGWEGLQNKRNDVCVCSDEMGLFPPCGTRESSSPFIVTAGYFRGFTFVTFQLLDKSLDDLKDYCCKKKKGKKKITLDFSCQPI